MGLGNSIEIKGINKLIKKIEKLPDSYSDPQLFAEIGILLKGNILKRTADSKDVDEKPFAPYSKRYAKLRASKGLPTKPDLFFRGDMLSALTYEATGTQVRLFFMSTVDSNGVSNAAKAYYNQQLRRFFGYNSSDVDEILKLVYDRLERGIRE